MSATQIIEEIKKLPESERVAVVKWIFDDDDSFFAWADSLPREVEMTEEEILRKGNIPVRQFLRQIQQEATLQHHDDVCQFFGLLMLIGRGLGHDT